MIRYCPKCGKELSKNGKFCASCGYQIQSIEKSSDSDKNPIQEPIQKSAPEPARQPAQKEKGNGKAIIAAVSAIALVGICAGGYFLLHKKQPSSVNMNPYLAMEFSGVDGEGYVDCTFDLAKMISDNKEVFSLNEEQRKKIINISHIENAESMSDNELIKSLFADMYDNGPVCVQIEPETGLHNDDKVTASWICGEETLEDLFGVNFIFDHSSYTVKDLEENKAPAAEADDDKKKNSEDKKEVSENNDTAEADTKTETETVAEPAAEPETPKDYGKYKLVNTDYLTLRSTPTLNNKNNKMFQIPGNAEVTVLEFGCNGYWKVNYQGSEGYIVPSYLAPSAGAVSPKKSAEYRIITDYVTLRDIPSTDGEAKMTISNGAVVEYYDTADNGFMLIQYAGQMGYILKNYNGEVLVQKV